MLLVSPRSTAFFLVSVAVVVIYLCFFCCEDDDQCSNCSTSPPLPPTMTWLPYQSSPPESYSRGEVTTIKTFINYRNGIHHSSVTISPHYPLRFSLRLVRLFLAPPRSVLHAQWDQGVSSEATRQRYHLILLDVPRKGFVKRARRSLLCKCFGFSRPKLQRWQIADEFETCPDRISYWP